MLIQTRTRAERLAEDRRRCEEEGYKWDENTEDGFTGGAVSGGRAVSEQDIEECLALIRRMKKINSDWIMGIKACFDDVAFKDGDVVLYTTEARQERTNWVRVLGVGPDVKYVDAEWFKDYEVYMVFPEHSRFSYCAHKCLLHFCREKAMDDRVVSPPRLAPFVYLKEKKRG